MENVKKIIRNLVFFLVLIILTFWILFKDQDLQEIINITRGANLWFVLLGVLIMLTYFLMEALNIRSILKSFGEKINIFKALKFTLIGFFFSAITPAASGGQPMEIYYMTKENISGAKSTLSLLIQLCGFLLSTVSLGILSAIVNPEILNGGLTWLFLLGAILNSSAIVIFTTCIFSKTLTSKLVKICIKFLTFIKYKRINEVTERINKGLEKYNGSADYIKTHKRQFIGVIIRTYIQAICYYLISYCTYKAFGLNEYNIFQLLTMQAVLYTTTSGIPLPGAVGISESVFLGIFVKVFGEELVRSAMLLSRGISFYLFVMISMLVVIVNIARTKNNKEENLQEPELTSEEIESEN